MTRRWHRGTLRRIRGTVPLTLTKDGDGMTPDDESKSPDICTHEEDLRAIREIAAMLDVCEAVEKACGCGMYEDASPEECDQAGCPMAGPKAALARFNEVRGK